MKNEILETLRMIEYLKSVSYTNEKIYGNITYKMIFDSIIEYKKFEIHLKICIPKDWDRGLIDIYITNYENLPYIPHVEKNGKVCLFQLEGILIERNLIGILVNCIERMRKVLIDGINKKNKYDFIDEFASYILLLPEMKIAKLLMELEKETVEIKCAIPLKEIKYKRNKKYKEINQVLISDCENDFNFYNCKYTIYNGISIYIDSKKYIYPPDWRKEIDISYINDLLNNISSDRKKFIKYMCEKKKNKFIIFFIKQPNEKYNFFGIQCSQYDFDENTMNFIKVNKINPISVYPISPKQLCSRGGGSNELFNKKILIIGCGSIGGYLIEQIVKAGAKNLEIIDDDILKEENIYRHVLGMQYIGRYKTEAISSYIRKNIPKVNIVGIETTIEDAIGDGSIELEKYDLIISAVGNHNVNRWINRYIFENNIQNTVMYIWNEVLDVGNHIAVINPRNIGCYECFLSQKDDEEIYDRTSYCEKGQDFVEKMQGCGSEYLPYSSNHSLRIVTYAIEIIREIFANNINNNILFSLKGTDFHIKKLGYKTSNRYNMQDKETKTITGGQFRNKECEICGRFSRNNIRR